MHRGTWILQSQARTRIVPHVEIFQYAERKKFFGERYLLTESRAYGSQGPLQCSGATIFFSQLDIDLHLVIQWTPMHALQALDRPIGTALLAILSISRQTLNRCIDEIPPQQTVEDVGSHRATLQLSENIIATGMAMDTFIGVELLQLLRRSLQPTIQIATMSEDAVLFKIPLLKRVGDNFST